MSKPNRVSRFKRSYCRFSPVLGVAVYGARSCNARVDWRIDTGPLAGIAAYNAGWHALARYVASGNFACLERDEAIAAARTVVGDVASKWEASKEIQDARGVVEDHLSLRNEELCKHS